MVYIALALMSNLKFSFLPSEDEIVERSYLPLLEILDRYPQIRADLFFSGYSEQTLALKYPNVFYSIKNGVDNGRFRISTNGFEHIDIPFFSYECACKNISKGIETDKKVWGIDQPEGYWPSEYFWDPTLGGVLNDAGIRWTFTSIDEFVKSCPGGKYPGVKDYDTMKPVYAVCTDNVKIPMFIHHNNNLFVLQQKALDEWFGKLEELKASRNDDVIFCAGFDMETILALEILGIVENGAECFESFMHRLTGTPGLKYCFMGDYLHTHPPVQEIYVRHAVYDFHTTYGNGAQRLMKICDAAERDLIDCEEMIKAGLFSGSISAELDKAWEYLLMSRNADAHYTENKELYPSSHVIKAAYENAFTARKLAKELKYRM